MVAVHSGLIHQAHPGQLGGPHPHPVDLDVVGVAVGAALVVAGEQVGALVGEDGGQPGGGLGHIGLPEALGVVIGGVPFHAGVGVTQHLHPVRSQYLRRGPQLGLPDRSQTGPVAVQIIAAPDSSV